MLVLQLLWRHFRCNCHLQHFLVIFVEPFIEILENMHVCYILSITVVCVATNGRKYSRYLEAHELLWDASW